MKREWKILLVIVVVVLAVVIVSYSIPRVEVANFEECIAAGNPVMESYPRQCRDGGETFVEVIDDAWRIDGVSLMQHESERYYGCFGCGDKLCVDPIAEMKIVDESSERYCSPEFEVIESLNVGGCSKESRNVEECIEIYQPVCADVQVECITAPCNPVKETFSNSCFACMNERVESYVDGECQFL